MANQRRAGVIQLQVNGEVQDAKGAFTYNLGIPKRDPIIGSDGKVHGYKEAGQPGFIEGAITDRGTLDLKALVSGQGLTITLTLGNDKVIALGNGFFAGDGTPNTEEQEIPVRWVGDVEEITL